MKTGRFNDAQIMVVLKQTEGGTPVSKQRQLLQVAREVWRHALSADYLVIACWVIDASLIAEMKDMAEQNRRLKKMYAEMSMQNDLLKEVLGKKR